MLTLSERYLNFLDIFDPVILGILNVVILLVTYYLTRNFEPMMRNSVTISVVSILGFSTIVYGFNHISKEV